MIQPHSRLIDQLKAISAARIPAASRVADVTPVEPIPKESTLMS
jgi:hypothetical protein